MSVAMVLFTSAARIGS
jgi:hypothetical protein